MDRTVAKMTWKVVDLILEKMASLVGETALRVLDEVKSVDRSQDPDPSLLYRVGNELADVFGSRGAYAVIRQVGREVGELFTKDLGSEEARKVMEETLRHLGFAVEIQMDDEATYICQCVFHDMIEADGGKPIQKPVCWTGWGFIEGCLTRVNGTHHIQWKSRDYEQKKCRFEMFQSADDYEPTDQKD